MTINRLKCKCGSYRFSITYYQVGAPVQLECTKCGRLTEGEVLTAVYKEGIAEGKRLLGENIRALLGM